MALTASGFFVREVGRGTFVAGGPARFSGDDELLQRGAAAMPGAGKDLGRRLRVTLSFVEGASNILDSDYYGNLYRGVASALAGARADVDVTLAPVATGDFVCKDSASPADGRLVFAPRQMSVASLEGLWTAGKPLVVVGASWSNLLVPCALCGFG